MSDYDFAIEQNFAPPTKPDVLGRNYKYPFPSMYEGDSFFVPDCEVAGRMYRRVQNAGRWFCLNHRPDLRCVVKAEKGGVRCWLVAR